MSTLNRVRKADSHVTSHLQPFTVRIAYTLDQQAVDVAHLHVYATNVQTARASACTTLLSAISNESHTATADDVYVRSTESGFVFAGMTAVEHLYCSGCAEKVAQRAAMDTYARVLQAAYQSNPLYGREHALLLASHAKDETYAAVYASEHAIEQAHVARVSGAIGNAVEALLAQRRMALASVPELTDYDAMLAEMEASIVVIPAPATSTPVETATVAIGATETTVVQSKPSKCVARGTVAKPAVRKARVARATIA